MLHLFKSIVKCYFFITFIWGNIAQAIPSKEEALEKLSAWGVDSDAIAKISNVKANLYPTDEFSETNADPYLIGDISDIKTDPCAICEISDDKSSTQNICCWLDIDLCMSQCPKANKDTKLDIYYHWLVAGLRQMNPFVDEEYVYIKQALEKADGIDLSWRKAPDSSIKFTELKLWKKVYDFGLRLAELKFIYLWGPDAYTDFFKIYAMKKMETSKRYFQEIPHNFIESWNSGGARDRSTIFDKVLSDIYLHCEDDILSTELMFYWIGFAMHSATGNSCCLNKKIDAALTELACTEDVLQEKIGCSVEKLRKMLQDAKTVTSQKNRRVKFGEDVFEAPRIRSMGSAPLLHPNSFKGQPQPFIKMARQPQSY